MPYRRRYRGLVVGLACALALTAGAVGWGTWAGDHCAVPSAQPSSSGSAPAVRLTVPASPRVLIFGDSYTEGYGAVPTSEGYAYRVGAALNWQVTVDGVGGTGYVATGPRHQGDYLTRLAAAPAGPFDLVVLQGSSNDQHIPAARLQRAVEQMVSATRRRYPTAQLMMLAPVAIYGGANPERAAVGAVLADYAAAQGLPIVDPIREGWFAPGSGPTYANPVNGHPNNAGYARIADLFAADAKRIVQNVPKGCLRA